MRKGFKGGQLKILSEDQLEDLYLAILSVLEMHGVKIEHSGALKILGDAGAFVDHKKKIARFPEYLVEESLEKAPKKVRLCGRDSDQDFIIEGKKVFFGTSSGTTHIIDLETGERRKTRLQDVVNTAKLSDALPNIDYAMGLATPFDVPTEVQGLYEQYAIMANTVKHSIVFAYHGAELTKLMIKIAELVAGGEEELKRRAIVSMYDEPQSPLVYGEIYVEALIEWVKRGLPVVFAPCPITGATAPVTLAGSIVQGMAESIGGNVLVQILNPGTPFIFGFVPMVMDMRTTVSSYGAIEDMLLGTAQAQLCHYLKIPMWGTGGCSDSKVLDGQAFAEATRNLMVAALGGQNLIHDIGYIESAITTSHEILVFLDEVIGETKLFMKGVKVDEETLAVNEIMEAGHAGNFLTLKHTRKHFKEEHFVNELLDRSFSHDMWMKLGGKDIVKRTREKALKLLKEHYVEPLPKDIKDESENILREALKVFKGK